ncbi:hypothetical protein KSS87_016950, partial [Heliosperma pusillum]
MCSDEEDAMCLLTDLICCGTRRDGFTPSSLLLIIWPIVAGPNDAHKERHSELFLLLCNLSYQTVDLSFQTVGQLQLQGPFQLEYRLLMQCPASKTSAFGRPSSTLRILAVTRLLVSVGRLILLRDEVTC